MDIKAGLKLGDISLMYDSQPSGGFGMRGMNGFNDSRASISSLDSVLDKQVQMQMKMQMFNMRSTMIKNRHDTLMSVIRNSKVA